MQDYSGYSGYGQPPSGGPTAPLPPMPPRPPRRRIGLLSYVAVALAAGALGAGTVVALYHPAANSSASSSASAQPSSSVPVPLPSTAVPMPSSGGTGTTGGSLSKVEQGIVIINTTLQYRSERAAGTGMVINAGSGLVLTNNHVIENSTKITATVAATGQKFGARVVGYDVTGDIALIQLQNPSGLHAVPVGDSAKVGTGDAVTALGNADGRSAIVPAPGHITGVNRTITASDQGGTVQSETLHGMLQTDAAIVSGDSGGPLVNAAGQVIGMDTAGNDVSFPDQQQSPAGFAIPIKTALSVARQIAAGQASDIISIGYPPFVGIYVGQGTSSDPQQQAAAQQQNNGFGGFGDGNGFGNGGGGQSCYTSDANLPVPSTIAPVSSGTLVVGTICSSPAATAGVTAGSVITAVNGQAIGAPQTLHNKLAQFRPNDTVSLTWVTPSGQRKTATLTLTPGPPL